jgi:hypothetical protein
MLYAMPISEAGSMLYDSVIVMFFATLVWLPPFRGIPELFDGPGLSKALYPIQQ